MKRRKFTYTTTLNDFQHARLYRNKSKSENPPHIFAIAEAAYREMNHMHQSQCVVISGESGSGKTESANLLVRTRSIVRSHSLTTLPLTGYYKTTLTVEATCQHG